MRILNSDATYFIGLFFWSFLEICVVLSFSKNILGMREDRKIWKLPITLGTMLLLLCLPEQTQIFSLGILTAAGYVLCRGGRAQRMCMALHGAYLIFYNSYLRMFLSYRFSMDSVDILVCYWVGILLTYVFSIVITGLTDPAYGEIDQSKDGWLYAGISGANFLMLWIFDWMCREGYDLDVLQLMMIVITVFTMIDYLLMVYYQNNISKVKAIRMLGEFQKKSELDQEHLKRLEEVYSEFKGMAHDMNHYLTVLAGLSNDVEQSAAQITIIDEIKTRMSHIGQEFYCMRPVLNALLNEKEKKAKELGIDMEIFVEAGFDFDGIDDYALIGIVSNLIDNALEASEQCEDKKWVSIHLFAVNDGKQKFMRVENSQIYQAEVKMNRFFTTKQKKKDHGYGLKNVRMLVEENHGKLRLKSEGERFLAEVIVG